MRMSNGKSVRAGVVGAMAALWLAGGAGAFAAAPAAMRRLASDFFVYKRVQYVCNLSCESQALNVELVKHMSGLDISVSVGRVSGDLDQLLRQWTVPVGALLDLGCAGAPEALDQASRLALFDSMHVWLVLAKPEDDAYAAFQPLNLSVDADIALASPENENVYRLTDIFNFGKIQGNDLEATPLGRWRLDAGLHISLAGSKYYNRWDFHNLTLRAVSVVSAMLMQKIKKFDPRMLTDPQFQAGVARITKAGGPLLELIREQHNFRFNITIANRWVGSLERNSTLAVTNSLFWREQDISYTCIRIFPSWLQWMQPFPPPPVTLETKFYYLIPETGVGDYENQFLTPLSCGLWVSIAAILAVCAGVLAGGAAVEAHPEPVVHATYSVAAAICQQDYEDGIRILNQMFTSQGRRLAMLTVGLTSMVLYNYYTSSVVSWLLNAAAPSIASIDGLIASDLELVFEDMGYTKTWLDNPGMYIFSGYKNVKEDELREKKVINARHSVPLMQAPETGIELIRNGAYAYHTEPYTASQVIGRRFSDHELCRLGALPLMLPKPTYIMGQTRSPYKEFFTWRLSRLMESGHYAATRARLQSDVPACAGSSPRALALGQAAPAFAVLAQAALLSALLLTAEVLSHRMKKRRLTSDLKGTHTKSGP